jgi:uncharacterized protein YmfQ (DUF2313 family)
MSRHFVNAAWPDYYAADGGPVVFVDCTDTDDAAAIDTRDALSEPDVETLLPSGLALWPRGAAWGTPDGEAPSMASTIAGLTRALLAPFADLYRRLWRVSEESRPSTIVDSLEDWEREFGLPDPCVSVEQSDELRRKVLRARVRSLATITPADVVRLAASLGYVVALEEPFSFRVGESGCGEGEAGSPSLDLQWVVHLYDLPTTQFEAGLGEAGTTRLLDFDIGTIECAVRRIAPAWTYPIFSLAPLPIGFVLTTETGAHIVIETGAALVAPFIPST